MGVVRKVITAAVAGARTPKRGDKVRVHCTGYLTEGRKKFWSTKDNNEPFEFQVGLGMVIRGWDEGVMQMALGEHSELEMTGDYGYGPRGFPAWGIPPNAGLTFAIELLAITEVKKSG